MHRVPLELVAVIACPHVGLLTSKLGGKASTILGAPQSEEIIADDRKRLAECYELSAQYVISSSKRPISLLCELPDRKTTVSVDIAPPSGKAAKASLSWAVSQFCELEAKRTSLLIDWKGRNNSRWMMLEDFLNEPEKGLSRSKDAPKKFVIMRQKQDVRRFKSRQFFVSDIEAMVLGLVGELQVKGLV